MVSIQLQTRSQIGKYSSSLRGVIPAMAMSRMLLYNYSKLQPIARTRIVFDKGFGFAATECFFLLMTDFVRYTAEVESVLYPPTGKKHHIYCKWNIVDVLFSVFFCQKKHAKLSLYQYIVWPLWVFGNPYQSLSSRKIYTYHFLLRSLNISLRLFLQKCCDCM